MDKTETLGERIKKLRKVRRLTQPQLAQKVGRNPHTIKDYEAGRAVPPWETTKKLAEALGVSHLELMDTGAPVPKPLVIPASDILKKYLKIPDDIVEMAQEHDLSSEVWKYVRIAFEEVADHHSKKTKVKKTQA